MVNVIPDIHVTREIIQAKNTNPLIRDVICLIGCFEDGTVTNTPTFCKTLTEAEEIFGDDTSVDANAALKQIFHKNISGCLIVNIPATGSGDNINRNITKTKLEAALDTIQLISFDQLYVASELTDELVTVVDTFYCDRFEDKIAHGWVGVGTRTTTSPYTAYKTTAAKLGDGCRAFLTQPLIVNGETLSLVESGAYLTNLIATLPVGNSLTAKQLTEVTGVGTTYTFEDSGLGKTLVEQGFFVVRLIDPLNNIYECVNSANHNGLDLYIGRVTDYIVNEFALREFLGEYNDTPTYDQIKMECNRIYTIFKDELKLIKGMSYSVEKGEPESGEEDYSIADVIIHEIVFANIITKVNLKIAIKVE